MTFLVDVVCINANSLGFIHKLNLLSNGEQYFSSLVFKSNKKLFFKVKCSLNFTDCNLKGKEFGRLTNIVSQYTIV